MTRVPRHRDAPAPRPLPNAGDAEVPQALADECEGLVSAGFGYDAQPAGFEQFLYLLLIGGEAEEVVRLLHDLGLRSVGGTAAVLQVLFEFEVLAAHAVEAPIPFEKDILLPAGGPEFGGASVVIRAGGTDKAIRGEAERADQFAEDGRILVTELLDGEALPGRGLHVFERVFIGTGEEEGVIAPQPAPAGDGVRLHKLQGKSDVGAGVHIGDRRGDIAGVHGASFLYEDGTK